MRRSAVEEYLESTAPQASSSASRRAPPSVPSWAEQVQQEGLRDYTIPEVRQAYGRTTQSFMEQEARRVAANAAANDELLRAYRERVGQNPTASFRSATAPQQDQGRMPQPYSGVGVGERLDPGGGGPEEREPQEYAGTPGDRYNPYEGMAPPPAGTGPPRNPGGAPQPAPEPAPEPAPAPAPFENVDEPVYESAFQYRPVTIALPPPFNSSQSIIATFGPNPRAGQIKRIIGLTFHPDKGGTTEQFQNAVIAVNNAYGKFLVGQGRRKYRY